MSSFVEEIYRNQITLFPFQPEPVQTTTMTAGVDGRLQGKVALITGGASGIGECAARLFAGEGATVVIADVQDELGQSLCNSLLSSGKTVSYVHCDVTIEDQVKDAVDLCVSKYGKLDIMFNNAGIAGDINPSIVEAKLEDLKRVLDVNLLGGFAGAKHAARVMIPAKKGSIIFTSSMASVICTGSSHAYTASKHALVGLTKNLSVELGSHGIRVNCISPFATVTPMLLKTDDPALKRQMEEYIALSANLKGAVMEAEDVAKAALYLASDDAKYVSGLNLVVDGGFSVTNPGMNPRK